jgi:hypothetical protein
VLSAMTTELGSAIPCNHAARFGVSPTIPRSCASPVPIKSPTTTKPVACECEFAERCWTVQSRPYRPLSVILVSLRVAEVPTRRHPCTSLRTHQIAPLSQRRTSDRPK